MSRHGYILLLPDDYFKHNGARRGSELGNPFPAAPSLQYERPIHARAETIHEHRLFRDAFRKRRCIAPMNAFFQKDKNGRRYAVSRNDGQPFGVAGIWENWKNPETSQWERTFALITVPANKLIAPIHDRMLAIIEPEDFERWLAPDDDDPRYLLKPYPAELMSIAPIGKTARRL